MAAFFFTSHRMKDSM